MRWIVLLLCVVAIASAGTYYESDYLVMGDLSPDTDNIVCERAQRSGIVHFEKEPHCCIDSDGTGYCSPNEKMLGAGTKMGLHMKYMWPTHTFKPSFSHKLMYIPCEGNIVITGKEYEQLLLNNNCTQVGTVSYCCPADAFPAKQHPTQITGSFYKQPEMVKKNPILLVDENRWAMVKKGIIKDMFVEKAIRTEDERCLSGGEDIFIFDQGFGSYFSDKRNYHEGERVFMFIKPDYDIVPLITWC